MSAIIQDHVRVCKVVEVLDRLAGLRSKLLVEVHGVLGLPVLVVESHGLLRVRRRLMLIQIIVAACDGVYLVLLDVWQ